MAGFEILGLALIAFIAYLYLPAATFRFGAEHFIDMRPRTDSSEIAEFIAASIPSFAFHFVTYGALRVVSVTLGWFISFTAWSHERLPWVPVMRRRPMMPVVDWTLVSSFLTGKHEQYVSEVIRSRTIASGVYFFAVVTVSLAIGLMFGASHLDRLRQRTAWETSRLDALVEWLPGLKAVFTRYPDSFARFPSPNPARGLFSSRSEIDDDTSRVARAAAAFLFIPSVVAWIVVELAYGITFAIGTLLFQEGIEPWFQWSERKPSVFVRTKDQRLYFGQFRQYSKKRSGEMDTLTIDSPWRYCYDERMETIAEGRMPFAEFGGSLEIAREEVAEIHETTKEHFARDVYNRYVAIRILFLRQSLLATFAGERLTLDEMWIRRGGGDQFTKDDFYLALQELVLAEVIGEFQGTPGAKVYTFASRRGRGPQPVSSHSTPVDPPQSMIASQPPPDPPNPPLDPPPPSGDEI